MNKRAFWIVVLSVCACSVSSNHYVESRPQELVGQYVLSHADGTWGDTATWKADGTLLGSTNHEFPSDARWVVRTRADNTQLLCVSGGNQANCQPFTVVGDTLIWGRGANADRFRRITSAKTAQ
jgi:hypothetical protein